MAEEKGVPPIPFSRVPRTPEWQERFRKLETGEWAHYQTYAVYEKPAGVFHVICGQGKLVARDLKVRANEPGATAHTAGLFTEDVLSGRVQEEWERSLRGYFSNLPFFKDKDVNALSFELTGEKPPSP